MITTVTIDLDRVKLSALQHLRKVVEEQLYKEKYKLASLENSVKRYYVTEDIPNQKALVSKLEDTLGEINNSITNYLPRMRELYSGIF